VQRARLAISSPAAARRLGQSVSMAIEPYRSAPRVFWIVDNCSSHQGACDSETGKRPQSSRSIRVLITCTVAGHTRGWTRLDQVIDL
jgi:hypothetical protein